MHHTLYDMIWTREHVAELAQERAGRRYCLHHRKSRLRGVAMSAEQIGTALKGRRNGT
jgi:hypothetical protein